MSATNPSPRSASSLDESVTIVITRTIRAGHESAYEDWLHGVARASAAFPGYMGINVIRPEAPSRDWVLVFRYDTVEHLLAWENSPERAAWLERVAPMIERTERKRLEGLEAWFALPGRGVARPPPRWKMALVTWCVAFPAIQLVGLGLGPWLAPLPRLASGAVSTAVMVLAMTYALMPFATRTLAKFLYPRLPG